MRSRKAKKSDTLTIFQILRIFLSVHWQGVLIVLTPLIYSLMLFPLPAEDHIWVAFTLLLMATFWMTEVIPIAITGSIPIAIFPLVGILSTKEVCRCYMNDTMVMFFGSLYLANCIEQCGVPRRLAYFTVRYVGYSHIKLLLALCFVTLFVSLWISNTAATTVMVPINFALLRVFEEQKMLNIYDVDEHGNETASDITICYFCLATYSATHGGFGTLISTGTNLVFKGLYMVEYPNEPDHLSFPLFSAFGIPYMIGLEIFLYFYVIIVYFGAFRPHSAAARRTYISEAAKEVARRTIIKESKALGSLSYHEIMSMILFFGAMAMFFSRSPQIFSGWADELRNYFGIADTKFILDSALSMFAMTLMMTIPCSLDIFKHFTAKFVEDMPKRTPKAVLDWPTANKAMPYSYLFLLGGGFAMSTAAKKSGLNDHVGSFIDVVKHLPASLIILVVNAFIVFLTNLASNIVMANVFVPVVMNLAVKIGYNPLWLCIVAGISASLSFILPVGTPGNLIVQSAAKIPTRKMMLMGLGPSIGSIIVSWFFFNFWIPVVWPVVTTGPPKDDTFL